MLNLLIRFIQGPRRRETYYQVSKDGALVLNRDELIQSGKMDRQIEAARELKDQALIRSRRLARQRYLVADRKSRQR